MSAVRLLRTDAIRSSMWTIRCCMSQLRPWITQTCFRQLKLSGTLNDRAGLSWPAPFHYTTASAPIRRIEPTTPQRTGSRRRLLWAVHVGRGEIVWQDRCDAANGSKEPRAAGLKSRPSLVQQIDSPAIANKTARTPGRCWRREKTTKPYRQSERRRR